MSVFLLLEQFFWPGCLFSLTPSKYVNPQALNNQHGEFQPEGCQSECSAPNHSTNWHLREATVSQKIQQSVYYLELIKLKGQSRLGLKMEFESEEVKSFFFSRLL